MIFIDFNRHFFSEVNRFKEELLESNIVDRPQDMSERLVKQLQDHTEFLMEELRNKNNMINCLLEQLSKSDDTIFSHKNQVHKFFFFSIWVFFHEHSRFTVQQGKGEGIYLAPLYHFHPLRGHLGISRAIAAGSSPLRIAGSRTRTRNLWFPSASR